MIDIWLILCQMVPFAEVVLLTAMEYQRDDQEVDVITETNLIAVATMNDEGEEGSTSAEKRWVKRIRQCFPQLKTLGL